jgi:hypothetical protein
MVAPAVTVVAAPVLTAVGAADVLVVEESAVGLVPAVDSSLEQPSARAPTSRRKIRQHQRVGRDLMVLRILTHGSKGRHNRGGRRRSSAAPSSPRSWLRGIDHRLAV